MTVRLFALADSRWPQIEAHYLGHNLITMRLDKFLNCVYAWWIERVPHEKVDQFEMMLSEPLPGQAPSKMAEEEEGQAFMSAMSTLRTR